MVGFGENPTGKSEVAMSLPPPTYAATTSADVICVLRLLLANPGQNSQAPAQPALPKDTDHRKPPRYVLSSFLGSAHASPPR